MRAAQRLRIDSTGTVCFYKTRITGTVYNYKKEFTGTGKFLSHSTILRCSHPIRASAERKGLSTAFA